MYGVDPAQFKHWVIIPALKRIGLDEPNRVALVLGTCLKESLLQFVFQVPNGPARGFGQMEPATHKDLWVSYLAFQPELANKVRTLLPYYITPVPNPDELIGNANYAVGMIAVHYRRVKAALPSLDSFAMSRYWKQYYNTPIGKGDADEAQKHFETAVRT